jgi:hypothetical protein
VYNHIRFEAQRERLAEVVPYVLRKRRFAAAYTPDIEIGAMRVALHERAANEPGCAG